MAKKSKKIKKCLKIQKDAKIAPNWPKNVQINTCNTNFDNNYFQKPRTSPKFSNFEEKRKFSKMTENPQKMQ